MSYSLACDEELVGILDRAWRLAEQGNYDCAKAELDKYARMARDSGKPIPKALLAGIEGVAIAYRDGVLKKP
jgi:hypothetical protein